MLLERKLCGRMQGVGEEMPPGLELLACQGIHSV
jgi:hypothetical protein